MTARITGVTPVVSVSEIKPRVSLSVIDPKVDAAWQLAQAQTTAELLRAVTTAAIPASDVAYILLRSDASLDTTGRFRYIPDVFIVTDAVAKAVVKGFSSTAAAGDSFSFDAHKVLEDSVSFAEFFVVTLIYLRDFEDYVSPGDTHVVEFLKAVADSVATTDAVARQFSKLLTDGVAMNDSFDIGDGLEFAFSKAIVNVVFTNDETTKEVSKGVPDLATVADFLQFVLAKAVSDLTVIVDSVALQADLYKSDVTVLLDALARDVAKSILGDSAGLFDSTNLSTEKAVSDMISAADSGSLVSQNYCDPTYFAEDYVGEYRTF